VNPCVFRFPLLKLLLYLLNPVVWLRSVWPWIRSRVDVCLQEVLLLMPVTKKTIFIISTSGYYCDVFNSMNVPADTLQQHSYCFTSYLNCHWLNAVLSILPCSIALIGQNFLKTSCTPHIFSSSQPAQHPPEPNLVTLKTEAVHSFKMFKQTKYTAQSKNPNNIHYLSANCH
jgi:hypothetical protein